LGTTRQFYGSSDYSITVEEMLTILRDWKRLFTSDTGLAGFGVNLEDNLSGVSERDNREQAESTSTTRRCTSRCVKRL
jgi:hypothetical protein